MQTVVSGCSDFQVFQLVITDGIGVSFSPCNGPFIASPSICAHELSDSVSIITRLPSHSLPETPSVNVRPLTFLAYTMPLWQRYHQVAAIARPPKESLNTSRSGPVIIFKGYARASPLISTARTISSSSTLPTACFTERI